VESWVASIEDNPDQQRSHTLFLIDTCYSGQAARLGWLSAATEQTRAWVIAASEPDAPAFNGRLTRAVTTVLKKVSSGELDFSPSTYVPFVHLVHHVRREVIRLGGQSQYVTGTPVDGLFEPPLLVNPRHAPSDSSRVALAEVDTLASPFGDLDTALDPAHFLDRAAGHRNGDVIESMGFFTGRIGQIQQLTTSLDRDHSTGLTVITGGPGSGKSALLGVMVCALHPRLRESTRHLWQHVPVPQSAWTGPLAAIHLRERTVGEAGAALIRQLHLPLSPQSTPREIVDAISALPDPPLIIFDALDEAAGQDGVHRQLLQPLATPGSDGNLAAHLWIGTRPWRQFNDLLSDAAARNHLIDLDMVPADQLHTELRDYIDDFLTHAVAYQDRSVLSVRRSLARGVADALTAPGRARSGEFLIAALYTHWLLRCPTPPSTPADVTALLGQIPADVPSVLDLDLSTREDQPWLTALLVTLAHAHGAGMPATVLRRAACAFYPHAVPSEITVPDFDRLLQQVRFYLRSTSDSDGTSLYRLFHQSLVDHLNSPGTDLSPLVDRILAAVPADDQGRPQPEAAEPYIQRHWIQHAADAGRIDLLVHEPPASLLLPLNAAARTRQGRLGAAIYRQSAHLPAFGNIGSRRQLLTIDAARYRARDLVRRLTLAMPSSSLRVVPGWATGGATTPWMRALLTDTGNVTSVAVGQVEGRTIIVSGSGDRTLRVWDAATGSPIGSPFTGHHTGDVTAVAAGQVDGHAVIISGSTDGTVRVWDTATGTPVGDPLTGHIGEVNAVAVGHLAGRAVIVSGSADQTVRVWDAATGAPVGDPITGHTWSVTTVAVGQVEGRTIIVSGSGDRTVRVWDAATGTPVGDPLTGHTDWVTSVTVGQVDGRTIIASGSDRTVRVWDAATGTPVGDPLTGHTDWVTSVTVGQVDGRTIIASGSGDRTVRVWDAATGTPVGDPLTGHTGDVTAVAVGQVDGRTIIASGSFDRTMRVWDVATSSPVGNPLAGHTGEVTSVAVGQVEDRTIVVSGSVDRTVRVRDAATGAPVGDPLTGHTRDVTAVAVGQVDGRTIIVSGSADGAVRVWDAATGAPVGDPLTGAPVGDPLTGHTRDVTAVAVGQVDGRTIIVSGSADGAVRVWDAATGAPVGDPLTGDADQGAVWVTSVGVGQVEGRTIIVSGSADGAVRVWDAATGAPVGDPLTGHTGDVTAVAVGQVDGRTILASGSRDHTVRVRHITFRRRRPHEVVPYWDRPITTVALNDNDIDRSITVALGANDGAFSLWRDETTARISLSWSLPYSIRAISHLSDDSWVVAFGDEIGIFREVT
jgi:WD40 repeat protein